MFRKLDLQNKIRMAKERHDFIKAGMLKAELDSITNNGDDELFNMFSEIFNPQENNNGTIRDND